MSASYSSDDVERSWQGFTRYMRRETDGMRHGRHALRRQWKHLRALAASCATQVSDKEVIALLGKTLESLDPEMNDLKALVAYCVGKGFTDGESLIAALQKDLAAEPMAFLAQHSGKSFGEKWGPAIAKYWLCGPSDRWVKKKAKDFYDIEWIPVEAGVGIRIELKASSEAPAFRFQQVRHPRLGELNSGYDILLCLGVTASSLEWWVIPTDHLDSITNNGSTPPDRIVIRKHHGKDAPIWNDAKGYGDEGWFCTDARCRLLLQSYLASNEGLRDAVLRTYGGQTT